MHDDLFSVTGQVVLVSGGSRGIGRALAEGFARRGTAVIITGRHQATLEQARPRCVPARRERADSESLPLWVPRRSGGWPVRP
jgi:short-subunit dehydrogenase involved in D-alanine esterification of teichoic acids